MGIWYHKQKWGKYVHIEIRKKCNIEENGYGGDKKVQYSVEGCSDSSKHTKKPHSYQY